MPRRNWQREELLLTLNLYCRLPFGQYHSRNPEIIQLAEFINRTPDAVAMKLSNFASFDPYHQTRGIKGLQNASRADQQIWDEFNSNWDKLAVESELLYLHHLKSNQVEDIDVPIENESHPLFTGITEAERQVKVRIGQNFFRKVILTSYNHKCCICEMPIPGLLIASHIIPWRDNEFLRVTPSNGLCFCVLHDKGFDRGLFTLGENYEVILGSVLDSYLPNSSALKNGFEIYEGRQIILPDKFPPNQEFLAVHRDKYFQGKT